MRKSGIIAAVAAVLAICSASLFARNRTLSAELAESRAELAEAKAEIAKAKAAKSPPKQRKRPPRRAESRPPEPAADAPSVDDDEFEKAVEERVASRMDSMRREREATREARRREWENESEEQRDARRREFQARMQERATVRLTEFADNVGLDESGREAFEVELAAFDSKVREIAANFAAGIEEGAAFDFETQARLMNEMSVAIIDAYAGLDETLPEDWRERDSGFNVMLGIGPDAFDPLFDAIRRSGGRGMGFFNPFMGGPPRR